MAELYQTVSKRFNWNALSVNVNVNECVWSAVCVLHPLKWEIAETVCGKGMFHWNRCKYTHTETYTNYKLDTLIKRMNPLIYDFPSAYFRFIYFLFRLLNIVYCAHVCSIQLHHLFELPHFHGMCVRSKFAENGNLEEKENGEECKTKTHIHSHEAQSRIGMKQSEK